MFFLFVSCSCIQYVTSSQNTYKKIVNKTEKELYYEVHTDEGDSSVFVDKLDSSVVSFYRESNNTQVLIGGTVRLSQILILREAVYNLTDTTSFVYDLEYSMMPQTGNDEKKQIYGRHLSYTLGDNSTDINSKILITLYATDSILNIMTKDYSMLDRFKEYYQQ